MFICLDQRTGTGCGAENSDQAKFCRKCGRPLRFALQFHDPGTLVGHYRIVRLLGRGGFGAVYEAEVVQRASVRVALKETFDANSIRSFQGEFAILRGLQHPHLPRYVEMFEANWNGYLVMELIPGQSLQDVLNKQQGPLQEQQVLGYALQICAALSYLHGQTPPILHRDIKPDNIRLTPEGLIKLVDFGLVKVGDGRTRSSRRALTPLYAPLEQWGGSGRTNARSDLYSLGATLYHLLTGREPIPAPDRLAISPDPLPLPQTLNPNLSQHVAEAIMTAMGLQQRERYVDAATLRQALVGISVQMPPTPPAPATFIVCQKGSTPYRTINDAIKDAAPGAHILVRPGLYAESIIIDKPLEISGDGPRKDIIIESTDASCILMQTDQAEVRGLSLRCRAGQRGDKFCAVDIPQGQLVLSDCDMTSDSLASVGIRGADANPIIRKCQIHDGQSGGVYVHDNGQGTVEGCDIFGNAYSGVVIKQGCNPIIRKCQIHDGKSVGVWVHDNGQGTVEECDIFGNANAGVRIEQGSNPIIRKCQIHHGKQDGVWVLDKGQGTVEECDIFGNTRLGVQIKQEGNPIIRKCQIHDGKQAGVLVHDNGQGTLEECNIFGNSSGVRIMQGSNPIIRQCQIHDCRSSGVTVHHNGQGTVEECDIFGNANAGVAISGGSNPIIRRCQIHDGQSAGVLVVKNGQGRVEECDIFGNANAGVAILEGGNPVIRQCQINRNGAWAVRVHKGGTARVENCDLTNNARGAWNIEGGWFDRRRVKRSGNKE